MAIRYKDGTYTPLTKPLSRRIEYGATNKDISKYSAAAQKSIKAGLKDGTVGFENTDEGGEYISNPKKKRVTRYKKNFVDKLVDRILEQ